MAVFERWFEQDLLEPIRVHSSSDLVFTSDNLSNIVGVELFRGGVPVNVSGTVFYSIIRSDGTTVENTGGIINGNKVSITLTNDDVCVQGKVSIMIQLRSGDTRTTVLKAVYYSALSSTDDIVDPSGQLPLDVSDLISRIDSAEADLQEAIAEIPQDYSDLEQDVADLKSAYNDWMTANDFIGILTENTLQTPYSSDVFLNNSIIISDGSIRTDGMTSDKAYVVSPLVAVNPGIYGLKVICRDSGTVGNLHTTNGGFGLFASDGTTPVTKPSSRTDLSNNIYLFEVPNTAAYIRFVITKGSQNDENLTEATGWFNQWILLPNANGEIDDSFFVIGPKVDGTITEIERTDGSTLTVRDSRVGTLSELDTTDKTDIVSAINEVAGSIGDGGADRWLVTNDFNATVNGKTNTLLVPYTYGVDSFVNNSVILSNGTIRTDGLTADKGNIVSPLISVTEGTYGLLVSHSSTVGNIHNGSDGFGLFGSDGTTVVTKPSARTSLGNDIYLFEVPATAAYIRFVITKGSNNDNNLTSAVNYFNQWILLPDANSSIDSSFFTLATKKDNSAADKIMRIDGSYVTLVDTAARANAAEALARPITFGRRTCAIFRKVCCIGDSYTRGYIMNTSGTPAGAPEYSWPEHMANMTGREYVNLGISGATTGSWLSNEDGLTKMQIPANLAQAYIIGLQINDAANELTVGTVSDIGTSAETYYGYTSKIVDEIFAINDDSHVFLLTQPKNYTGIHTPYREAILNIVDWYQDPDNGTHQTQVHLLDLLPYYQLFQNAGCHDSMANGHYTAVGYEYVAEIMMYAWSNYMNTHPLAFQDVNLIPFGTAT